MLVKVIVALVADLLNPLNVTAHDFPEGKPCCWKVIVKELLELDGVMVVVV